MKSRLLAAALIGALGTPVAVHAQAAPSPETTIAAAKKGNAEAQYRLGEMYDLGKGVPQDYAQAVQWYRRAAEQGHAPAQFALAEMYKNGDGVAKDIKEALRWYRRAADGGSAGAQLLLGVLYESGMGVATDLGEAARWYRKSADQGDARAQVLLGNLYQLGQGVPRNAIVAFALYSVATATDASPGNPALQHRAQLARAMTPTDVVEAQALGAAMAAPGNFAKTLDRYLAAQAKR
jgi:TPR repeat protein